jgi:hypothetical protein
MSNFMPFNVSLNPITKQSIFFLHFGYVGSLKKIKSALKPTQVCALE